MSKRIPRFVSLTYCIALLAWCAPAFAESDESRTVEVGGLLFGDLYTIPSHHTAAGDGASGFVLRRGYLTANFTLGDTWSGRAHIAVNQDGEFESYGFEADFKELLLRYLFTR